MKDRTYINCKSVITSNRYEYEDMYAKLDLFLLTCRLTDVQYLELAGMLVAPELPTVSESEQESLNQDQLYPEGEII